MRVLKSVVLLLGLLGLSGCIPLFLHAGYTANDHETDARLVGTWVSPGNSSSSLGADTLSIAAEEGGTYRVNYRDGMMKEGGLLFRAHLFRINGQSMMDLEPHPSFELRAFYVYAHQFARVGFSGDTLLWDDLDESWALTAAGRREHGCGLDTLLASGGDTTAVITGGTPAVRALLAAALADRKAFGASRMVPAGGRAAR